MDVIGDVGAERYLLLPPHCWYNRGRRILALRGRIRDVAKNDKLLSKETRPSPAHFPVPPGGPHWRGGPKQTP